MGVFDCTVLVLSCFLKIWIEDTTGHVKGVEVAPSRVLVTQSSVRDTPHYMTVFEEEIQAVLVEPYSWTLASESCLNHIILGRYVLYIRRVFFLAAVIL